MITASDVATSLFGNIGSETERHACPEHGEFTAKKILGRWTTCPACVERSKALVVNESIRVMALQRQENKIKAAIGRSGIPHRYAEASFDDWEADSDEQMRILASMRLYVHDFKEMLRYGVCHTFLGNIGAGKSHLACAVANELMKAGYTAVFSSARELYRRVWDANKSDKETSASVLDALARVDLLIIDEVGGERGTDAEAAQLFEIIDTRNREVKPTIMISNLSPKDFVLFVGDRAVDRLIQSGGGIHQFTWESYRRKPGKPVVASGIKNEHAPAHHH